MSQYVHWNLEVAIAPGKLEAFRALVKEMVAGARDEAGCVGYDWNLSEDGSVCHIFEHFKDAAGAMVHLGLFGTHFAKRFLELVKPGRFDVYGWPNADVRAALAGFKPTYFKPLDGFMR